MDKRLRFRIIIAATSVVAALIVLGLSSGLFSFWGKRTEYIVGSGNYKGKVYYYTKDVSLKVGETKETDFGSITFIGLKTADNGVIAEFSFKSTVAFSSGKILSAKPLFGTTRDYMMKVFFGETALDILSQSYDKTTVYCSYLFYGDASDLNDTPLTLTDIIINEYKRK